MLGAQAASDSDQARIPSAVPLVLEPEEAPHSLPPFAKARLTVASSGKTMLLSSTRAASNWRARPHLLQLVMTRRTDGCPGAGIPRSCTARTDQAAPPQTEHAAAANRETWATKACVVSVLVFIRVPPAHCAGSQCARGTSAPPCP